MKQSYEAYKYYHPLTKYYNQTVLNCLLTSDLLLTSVVGVASLYIVAFKTYVENTAPDFVLFSL